MNKDDYRLLNEAQDLYEQGGLRAIQGLSEDDFERLLELAWERVENGTKEE